MFERFTEDARLAVSNAQDEARDLGHNYIGTEHLLLAMLRDRGQPPAQVLAPFGIDRQAAREQVLAIVGRGTDSGQGQIPFTPRSKKVLELSLRESLALGHTDINCGHVMLGLLREREGVGAKVLTELGAPLAELRERVIERLGSGTTGGPRGTSRVEIVEQRIPEQPPALEFVARADDQLRRVLMRAAGLALADGREDITLADLRAAMTDGDTAEP